MKIGIEASEAVRGRPGGKARYATRLIMALKALDSGHEIVPLYPWRRLLHAFRNPAALSGSWYVRGRGGAGLDLIHATSEAYPAPKRGPEVATLHDLMDLTRPGMNPTAEAIAAYTGPFRRADMVVCVSQTARDDLHLMTDVPESRSVVVHLGVEETYRPRPLAEVDRVKARYRTGDEYVLFIGRPWPQKNIDRLLEAYARSRVDLPMVFVGGFRREHIVHFNGLLERFGIGDCIRRLGFVKERDLPALVTGANALAFPSMAEGFGLPTLEAMACGTPVMTSLGTATEEVAAGHAVLIDPFSVDDMAEGLERVLETDDETIERAMRYAQSFTWEKTARETVAVYDDLLGRAP
jgi:alpha-1,3-rhamnosyl/mannosyltransferase